MAVDFFKKFVNDLGDPDSTVASEGKSAAEFAGFIDTGSYILNAAISGSLFGGLPDNKAIVLAGDPATGKTFFALGLIKFFLNLHDDGKVWYFDTEAAVTQQMLIDRGIDPERVVIACPPTIEKFRTSAIKLLDAYAAIPEEKRFKMLIVLDSLSALPSEKEVTDITDGKDTKDMTKASLIKGAFRVLRLKMAKVQVPLIVTNHVYAVIGAYVPTKDMAGGSGAKYAADTIVMLSKAKEKDAEKHVIGSVITCRTDKSRLTREGTKVQTRIMHDGGLDRYYGLLDYAVAVGVVEKVGNKYRFPGLATTAFEKSIVKNPEKYFTKEVLDALDVALAARFKYSASLLAEQDTDETVVGDDE